MTRQNAPPRAVAKAALDTLKLISSDHATIKHTFKVLGPPAAHRLKINATSAALEPHSAAAVIFLNHTKALRRKVEKERKDDDRTTFLKWISVALEDGAGKAHKWANAPNQPFVRAPTATDRSSDPQLVASETANTWGMKWGSTRPHLFKQATAALRGIRQEALKLPEEERRAHFQRLLSPDRIAEVAKKAFKKTTAIGADQTAFRDIANSSIEARTTLSEILVTIAITQALPIQALINIMSMLGKKMGILGQSLLGAPLSACS